MVEDSQEPPTVAPAWWNAADGRWLGGRRPPYRPPDPTAGAGDVTMDHYSHSSSDDSLDSLIEITMHHFLNVDCALSEFLHHLRAPNLHHL